MPAVAAVVPARSYVRHQPESTLLFEIVRDHLDPFLAFARERSSRPLPAYVEQEFREYLKCGLLEHGFARAHCEACGRERFVAFSCKGRSLCPSCGARRMSATGAHLADHVLPDVPVGQFVLSLPYASRQVLAARADLLTHVDRIFVDEIFRAYKSAAGFTQKAKDVAGGAVTLVQRFGSLNLNVHLHVIVVDGVFVREGSERSSTFRPAQALRRESLSALTQRVARRVQKMLKRKCVSVGLPAEQRSNECPESSALDACASLASQSGTHATVDERGCIVPFEAARDEQRFGRTGDRFTAETDGFNVNAGVHVAAGDREGREKLARYCARPTVSLERLSRLPDGRIAYRLKHPGPHGHTHRVMGALEFMARLAALVAPPRYPLQRYHGVFAPRSSWRKAIVPQAAVTPQRACATPHGTFAEEAGNARNLSGGALEATSGSIGSVVPAGGRSPAATNGQGGRLIVSALGIRMDWATLLRRCRWAGVSVRRAHEVGGHDYTAGGDPTHPAARR